MAPQRQLRLFRQVLNRKHGRGKTYIPESRVENVHLMTPEQRSAALRASAAADTPYLQAVVRTYANCKRSERACEAGRWRLSAGRARPRGRRERRSPRATRAGPSGDPDLPPGPRPPSQTGAAA